MAYGVAIERKAAEAAFDLKGPAGELRPALAGLGLALPERPNSSARPLGDVVVYWIGEEHWLLCAPLAEEERLMAQLAQYAVQVSDALAAFAVMGPESAEVMVQATSLDINHDAFPAGSASRTEFFGLGALIAREHDGYRVMVERSYADFIEAALHRAAGFDLPVAPGQTRPGVRDKLQGGLGQRP